MDDGGHRTALDAVDAGSPRCGSRRGRRRTAGVSALQVPAVGLLEGRGGLEERVGARRCSARPGRPSQSMSMSAFQKTALSVPQTGDDAGARRHCGSARRTPGRSHAPWPAGRRRLTSPSTVARAAAGGPARAGRSGASRAAPPRPAVSELDTHDEEPSPGGTGDGHSAQSGAVRTVRPPWRGPDGARPQRHDGGRGSGPASGSGLPATRVGAGSATTAARADGVNSPFVSG